MSSTVFIIAVIPAIIAFIAMASSKNGPIVLIVLIFLVAVTGSLRYASIDVLFVLIAGGLGFGVMAFFTSFQDTQPSRRSKAVQRLIDGNKGSYRRKNKSVKKYSLERFDDSEIELPDIIEDKPKRSIGTTHLVVINGKKIQLNNKYDIVNNRLVFSKTNELVYTRDKPIPFTTKIPEEIWSSEVKVRNKLLDEERKANKRIKTTKKSKKSAFDGIGQPIGTVTKKKKGNTLTKRKIVFDENGWSTEKVYVYSRDKGGDPLQYCFKIHQTTNDIYDENGVDINGFNNNGIKNSIHTKHSILGFN